MDITTRERIFQVVVAIPSGKVASYGQVAKLAGLPGAARLVGATLKGLPPESKLPWHRVVNAAGKLSLPPQAGGRIQRERLEREGIAFTRDTINLTEYGWRP